MPSTRSRAVGCFTSLQFAVWILTVSSAQTQTFVQLADLDPPNTLGPRLTETVARNKLNGNPLFANLASKITLIDGVVSPAKAYEFASDGMWNRVLFGEKDVYIRAFTNANSGAVAVGAPGGLDISALRTLFITDRINLRILGSRFDAQTRTMTQTLATPASADFSGIQDVAWDGRSSPLSEEYVYVLDGTGQVSYWQWLAPAPSLLWTYGTEGSAAGQFNGPRGVCVGHAAGGNGGSVFTSQFYVADAGNKRLVWLERTPSGALWRGAAVLPDKGVPSDCSVDHFGNVYVADAHNSRLVKYTWNLNYLAHYGTYGVGAENHNTFAHPQAVHVPFGTKRNSSGQTIWYGEGRVITAEDWGLQSGAREHYLGVDAWITGGPTVGPTWASVVYNVTDHATHTVDVADANRISVRQLASGVLMAPGQVGWYWDGHRNDGSIAPPGNYVFRVNVHSTYGGTYYEPWVNKGFLSQTFYFDYVEPPPCKYPPCFAPPAEPDGGEPTTLFLRQRVLTGPQPLARVQGAAAAAPADGIETGSGALTPLVRQYGVRGLSFGVTREASASPVLIRVYSLSGRPVRTLANERLEPGVYEIGWDGLDDRGRPAGPGVYFAVLAAGGQRLVQRLILRQAP